jgi:hypothetical protein
MKQAKHAIESAHSITGDALDAQKQRHIASVRRAKEEKQNGAR